ncbi:MAG: SusF/SusE family outer membrane protein [Bacteroidaceae bacterium]|nr:SusF/SusE family outer membrane protein [Bacteroidaceae bacterium]
MKRLLLIFYFSLFTFHFFAQDRYWAVGTAVPGGIQELTPFPNKQYKYTGRLIEGGTLSFRNKEAATASLVRYLKPTYEDAYAVTNATPFTLVSARDSSACLWTVPLTEDIYRITIDLNAKTLTGELFRPWNELFIVGGATECGWVTYTFLPFTRDESEVCTWDWTGELRERQEFGEPRRFKFEGQNAWEPKVLHPFTQDEDILGSTQLLTGGSGDNKWSVTKEGYYHIRVDVFRETVWAEYLGQEATDDGQQATAIHETTNRQLVNGKWLNGKCFDLSGRQITNGKLPKGLYIKDGKKILVK